MIFFPFQFNQVSPFLFVSFYSQKQLEIKSNKNHMVIHADATGSIVPKFMNKRVFFYSFIYSSGYAHEPVLPPA